MRKFIFFAFFPFVITACIKPISSPIEQVQEAVETQPQAVKKTAKSVQNRATLYKCNQKKTVRITQEVNSKKNQNIKITFNQTTHTLSPMVTRTNSKKYSNLRWIWAIDAKGKGSLRNKNGKILAENCVKK